MKLPTLTVLSQWAHSIMAVLGVIAIGYGITVNIIATSDPTLSTKYANQILLVGAIITGASKFIDSLNAAITNSGTPTPPKAP